MEGEPFYAAALGRLYRVMAGLAIGGTAAAGIVWGWPEALAFGFAALAALAWFRGVHSLADSLHLGRIGTKTSRIVWGMVRFALILGGVYAIVKFTGAHILAPLAGFSIPVLAILSEAVYQLIYARA